MNSRSPSQATWRTADNTPWFLRSSKFAEPNGDYKANCYLNIQSAVSEDSITFNDWNCNINSNAYYCQPAKQKKKVVEEEPPAPSPPAPPPLGPPPALKPGGRYNFFKCASGSYTGANKKCGHFTGLSEKECWEKCQNSAHAGDKDSCDKTTGAPDCKASIYDKENQVCILSRRCTKLVEWDGHRDIVTRLKADYDPAADTHAVLKNRLCKGKPYTRKGKTKLGLKGITEAECWKGCFENKWTGRDRAPVKKCAAMAFYTKTGYCDFFESCTKTKRKKGVNTYKKLGVDEEEEEDDEDEDEEDEEEEDEDEDEE